jgi:hypothetical protein
VGVVTILIGRVGLVDEVGAVGVSAPSDVAVADPAEFVAADELLISFITELAVEDPPADSSRLGEVEVAVGVFDSCKAANCSFISPKNEEKAEPSSFVVPLSANESSFDGK